MMTPQEVAGCSFPKATLGGYNMGAVDEFLDALTKDYTDLYNDNSILKNKLKVLSDTVEEYRATDNAMRKTLLAAQQMADAMVSDAEKKRDEMEQEVQKTVDHRLAELNEAIAAEEYRLRQAQEATAAYLRKLAALHKEEIEFLSRLNELVPPEMKDKDDPGADIEAAMAARLQIPKEEKAAESRSTVSQAVPVGGGDEAIELDADATRRYSHVEFGKDYPIT